MPYTVKTHDTTPEGQDGPHCVHKVNPDGSTGEIVKCHMSHDKALAHQRALHLNVDEDAKGEETLVTTDLGWSVSKRKSLAAGEIKGAFAGPDMSFPIAGPTDVGDAWGLAGHADNPDEVRRKIISIAKRFGWTSGLPATARKWAEDNNISLSDETVDATDLSQFILLADMNARTVEFLRIGTFIDANGKKVEINDERLNALISNFEQGTAGQDVPIDILHRREEAAGWVQGIQRSGDKLLAVVAWNELGARLVADKVYRYLSATIDLTRNVLRSISLVNFPAVKGLAPLELAEANYFVAETVPPTQLQDSPGHAAVVTELTSEVLEMADDIKTEVVAAHAETAVQPTPTPAQTMLSENELTGLRKQMEAEIKATLLSEFTKLEQEKARMMTELMDQVREERNVAEFSQRVTGDGRNALPFTADEVKDLLTNLPRQHRAAVKDALQRIYDNGTVDFSERGTAKGGAPKRIAPDLAQALRNFVRSGGSIETFFEANSELGAMKDYDLAEFGG